MRLTWTLMALALGAVATATMTAGANVVSIEALGAAAGEAAAEALRATLQKQLVLSESELASLTRGKPIVKTLPATMNREMSTVGGVRIVSSGMTRFVNQFKTLEGFKTSSFIVQIQKFSDPPQLSDLDALVLEPDDIDSLRSCRVGACDVQLAAHDIKRFNSEVNWKSPNAARAATALYKEVLFAHLDKYRAGGRNQLLAYQDREATVKLAAETEALFAATPSILEHAPAFQQSVHRYPFEASADVEHFFYWSKEAFGFKPVVGLNHVSVYTEADTGNVMILTTQLYASHYLDGLISVHALLPDRASPNEPGFYWLYMNRTRVGRLGGLLGTISRPIVQRKARAGLMKSMQQTKQRFEAGR
jgi:hypothetical protein